MGEIAHSCPHCKAERTGLVPRLEMVHEMHDHIVFYQVAAQCRICRNLVVFLLGGKRGTQSPKEMDGDPLMRGWNVLRCWPEAKASDAPEHLPEPVLRAYKQGEANIRTGNWDAAGAMFRKTIDVATRDPAATKQARLVDRIDALAAAYAITPDLKKFAHAIRLDGNDAAHEPEFTEGQARDLHDFTRLFSMYFYTLPGMLKARETKPPSP